MILPKFDPKSSSMLMSSGRTFSFDIISLEGECFWAFPEILSEFVCILVVFSERPGDGSVISSKCSVVSLKARSNAEKFR